MTPLVAAAVLLAAVTHACWNAIVHRITDKLVGFTLIAGGGLVIGLAMLPFTAFPAAGAWPYLGVSAVSHVSRPRASARSKPCTATSTTRVSRNSDRSMGSPCRVRTTRPSGSARHSRST